MTSGAVIVERVVVAPQGPAVVQPRPPPSPHQIASPCSEQRTTIRARAIHVRRSRACEPAGSVLASRECRQSLGAVSVSVVGFGKGIGSRSTTNVQPSGRLMIVRATAGIDCGPQDSNLQPRDSRALAFPRGLDYLILLITARRHDIPRTFVSART